MNEARLPGFLLSLLLHLGILALVLVMSFLAPPMPLPAPPGNPWMGDVTIGSPGKAAPSRTPRTDPTPPARQDPPQQQQRVEPPKPQPTPPPRQTAEPVVKQPQQQPPTAKPPVDPDAIALRRNATVKPPQTNATAKADPVKPTTPVKPSKNATKPTTPPTTTAQPSKNATKPAKTESLADSLKALEKTTGPSTPGNRGATGRPGGRTGATQSALDSLSAELGSGDDDSGTGPGGTGGDGKGIKGAYGDSVVSRVRPHWSLPGQARNYTAIVHVKINPDGSVQKATLQRSSGSSYIDSSVMQAVMASQLEPPPPGMSEIEITFNTDDLAK